MRAYGTAREHSDALKRIAVLLLGLAALAERAAQRSRPVCLLALWFLRPAERVAREFVIDTIHPALAVKLLASMPERDRFMRGMASWAGFKQVPHDYDRDARYAGETKFPLRRMLRFASDAILGFSLLPVRVAGLLSGVFFVALFLLLGYVGISWAFFDPAPGWTSMALIVLTTSSVQLFTLAVISEYVGRIYMDSKRRPLFIIDEVTGQDPDGRDE